MNKRPRSITVISWIFIAFGSIALLCGMFMLYGFNWARWLLVIWLGYHVILSALHSLFELSVHSLLFTVVLYFLFRPPASTYFRGTRVEPPQIPKDMGEAQQRTRQ